MNGDQSKSSVDPNELLTALIKLRNSLRASTKKEWARILPFADMIFDRWEKGRFLGFGKHSSIYDSSLVFGDVRVGEQTWIGPFTLLDGTGSLTIGSYCSISAGVQIYTHDSVQWALSGGEKPYEYAPVKIGNRCYIGPQTVIAKGVEIGDECIIGALSYVDKNLPPKTKAWGRPLTLHPNP